MSRLVSWHRRALEGWRSSDKLRFLVVGTYNTLFGWGVFALLHLAFADRVHYLWLLVVAHFAAVTNAFVAHRQVTFQAQGSLVSQFLRFNLSYLGALGLGLVALPLGVSMFHAHPLVVSAVLTVLTVGVSYLLHRHFSFSRKSGSGEEP